MNFSYMKTSILTVMLVSLSLALYGCGDDESLYVDPYVDGVLVDKVELRDVHYAESRTIQPLKTDGKEHPTLKKIETSTFIAEARVIGVFGPPKDVEYKDIFDAALVIGWGPMSMNKKIRGLTISPEGMSYTWKKDQKRITDEGCKPVADVTQYEIDNYTAIIHSIKSPRSLRSQEAYRGDRMSLIQYKDYDNFRVGQVIKINTEVADIGTDDTPVFVSPKKNENKNEPTQLGPSKPLYSQNLIDDIYRESMKYTQKVERVCK